MPGRMQLFKGIHVRFRTETRVSREHVRSAEHGVSHSWGSFGAQTTASCPFTVAIICSLE